MACAPPAMESGGTRSSCTPRQQAGERGGGRETRRPLASKHFCFIWCYYVQNGKFGTEDTPPPRWRYTKLTKQCLFPSIISP